MEAGDCAMIGGARIRSWTLRGSIRHWMQT